MKIVLNKCYGGFGLSPKAQELYLKKIGKKAYFYKQIGYAHNNDEKHIKISTEEAQHNSSISISTYTKDMGEIITKHVDEFYWYERFDDDRNNKELIETIEELGTSVASGHLAKLQIVEIPDGVEWELDEYDGIESIHETHRSW